MQEYFRRQGVREVSQLHANQIKPLTDSQYRQQALKSAAERCQALAAQISFNQMDNQVHFAGFLSVESRVHVH